MSRGKQVFVWVVETALWILGWWGEVGFITRLDCIWQLVLRMI